MHNLRHNLTGKSASRGNQPYEVLRVNEPYKRHQNRLPVKRRNRTPSASIMPAMRDRLLAVRIPDSSCEGTVTQVIFPSFSNPLPWKEKSGNNSQSIYYLATKCHFI